MALLNMESKCVCGSKIKCSFRKPTRMQNTMTKVTCKGCLSRFLIAYYVEKEKLGRQIRYEIEEIFISEHAKAIAKSKQENEKVTA